MIYLSVCSRKDKQPKALELLKQWVYSHKPSHFEIIINYDSPSIYEGHKKNVIAMTNHMAGIEDDDIVVLCHDDVEIISNPQVMTDLLYLANRPGVGFLGVAGACRFDNLSMQGAWWNSRVTGEARGFVFQGTDPTTMMPNYFGKSGQVVVLDGCFLACSYKTLKTIGLDKPHYLSSDWDFYDIHLTFKAHLMGMNNYVIPAIIRHESPGLMREGWFKAKEQFLKYHAGNLPCMIPVDKTNGLPK